MNKCITIVRDYSYKVYYMENSGEDINYLKTLKINLRGQQIE